MVINAGEEAHFYVYDSARKLPEGLLAMALLNPSWVEAGLAMRVGPVDSHGLALVWVKNNTHNFLTLSPSPQALLDTHGVRLPEGWQPRAEPAAAIELPPSLAEIRALLHRLPKDGWMQAAEEVVEMAAEEDADLGLDDIARQIVHLHYANPVLNGATVLHAVQVLRKARLSGRAGHDLPQFQDVFLKMMRKLRSTAAAAQQRLQQRQPTPATSVRFTEPLARPDVS